MQLEFLPKVEISIAHQEIQDSLNLFEDLLSKEKKTWISLFESHLNRLCLLYVLLFEFWLYSYLFVKYLIYKCLKSLIISDSSETFNLTTFSLFFLGDSCY